MTDADRPESVGGPPDPEDPVLAAAGSRLRARARSLSPSVIEASVLRRRSRRLTVVAVSAFAVVVVLAGLLVGGRFDDESVVAVPTSSGASASARLDAALLIASLDDQPADPTRVRLTSSVSTFDDCGSLINDLRRVGAEHVGSRGFGSSGYALGYGATSGAVRTDAASAAPAKAPAFATDAGSAASGAGGTTLGTNVQVAGVDELDQVKAVGTKIYDLHDGDLRITDAHTLEVLSQVDVTPPTSGDGDAGMATAQELLAAGDRVVVFGIETEVSDPVAGDPSATRATTTFLTITFVDTADAGAPVVTDRVRVEGRLVSARLTGSEIRLVTTSDMADLGFVAPTTPTSVAKALEQNRLSVALSQVTDWIPDWQRAGGERAPLVPCDRVHVPDTFAGAAMTSMVTFPIGTTFEPAATSILAPGDTLYAGLDKVAISSGVWVDPIDRHRLRFDDWQTAVHEFSFSRGEAPKYEGSGIVDGSTVGQFAFGEIGDSLGVVTTTGTPWTQDMSRAAVDLVVLTPDGEGGLVAAARVDDLADGDGAVSAVRFVDGRVLVSTGRHEQDVRIVDVSDPGAPRRAGAVTVPGSIGYFHPLPQNRALLIGSRLDEVGSGDERRSRSWVQAHLLDVANPDVPRVLSTWERPWSVDGVSYDHHAFTYWPERALAMWGIRESRPGPPNGAVVLRVGDEVAELAVPVANKPNEVPPPCPEAPVTGPELRTIVGPNGRLLRCDDERASARMEWPRYECHRVGRGAVVRVSPGAPDGDYVACTPAPEPTVSRVLVVDGRPILLTEQTLEALDPETFASAQIAYHPTAPPGYRY